MADTVRIELENDEGELTLWEYEVHDLVRPLELKQLFYKALSDKYGLDVKIRLGNGKKTA